MWDPNVGLGTVTHQNIGYLWPMGPWFWTFEQLGRPDWVAQRLWLGTVMFAAGAGVVFLTRTLGWRGGAVLAAASLYMLSPYVLHYGARISVILLPWAACLARGADPAGAAAGRLAGPGGLRPDRGHRRRRQRDGARARRPRPLLWLVCSVVVHREVSVGDALGQPVGSGSSASSARCGGSPASAVQGSYGIDILRYTETVETVARTSLASEVLRGLGYWFFYGGDLLGPWIEPGRSYTQQLWLIALGFAVPILGFVAAVSVRWRYRVFAVALVLVGTTVAVGAHPYEDPSPLGSVFKELATSSTVGLALRSTPRAVPLVVLGLALLIGAASPRWPPATAGWRGSPRSWWLPSPPPACRPSGTAT
jgi:hypothetical protein